MQMLLFLDPDYEISQHLGHNNIGLTTILPSIANGG